MGMTEQDWQENRLGKFTASEINRLLSDLTAPEKKAGETLPKGARTFCYEVASEILTGAPFQDSMKFASIRAIEWGKINEPIAMEKYIEIIHKGDGSQIEYFGGNHYKFFEYGDWSGFSPDFIHPEIYGEIKCPDTHTHLKNIQKIRSNEDLKNEHPNYYAQMQFGMMGLNLDRGHFVSFDPRLFKANLFVLEIKKDEEMWELIDTRIKLAVEYTKNLIDDLNTLSRHTESIFIK
jgi:hypothetical protein